MRIQHQYLTLSERVSQVYLNKCTVVSVLLMVKVFLFKRSLISGLDRIASMARCNEDEAIEAAQYQQRISTLLNSFIQENLSQVRYNYLVILTSLVSIIKHMILLYVEIFLGTYTCLLNAAISGSANFALDTSESLIVKVNDTIVGVTEDIQDGLDGLSYIINTLVSSFNKIKQAFTGHSPSDDTSKYQDKINISIDALRKIQIPSSVLDSIEDFRSHDLPNFVNLENTTSNLVSSPFDFLNKQLAASSLNSSLARSTKFMGNESLPSMNGTNIACLNEFDNLNRDLSESVSSVTKYILIALLTFSIVSMIPLVYGQYRRWRRQDDLLNEINEIPPGSPISLFNVLNRYNNSLIYCLVRFNIVKSSKILWLISYITSPYVTTVFFIAVSGLVVVSLQYIVLRKVNNLGHNFIKQNISKSTMVKQASNSTSIYIAEVNKYLANEETLLNIELFGNVHNISVALNSTLVTFMDNLNHSINEVFGKTPLAKPVSTIVYCTLGRKVNKVETGLAWVIKNVKVSIPKVGPDMEKNLANLANQPAKNLQNLAAKSLRSLIELYKSSLWLEFLISIVIFGLFVLQVIIGLAVIGVRSLKDRKPTPDLSSKVIVSTDIISDPKPLSTEQRKNYGYPFTNPYDADDFLTRDIRRTHSQDEKDQTSSSYPSISTDYPLRDSSNFNS